MQSNFIEIALRHGCSTVNLLHLLTVYKCLLKHGLLHEKQFVFHASPFNRTCGYSVSKSFEDNKHTLGIFIDLSKVFDIADHNLLLKIRSLYGIKGNYRKWFSSYLSNRKQFIKFNNEDTDYEIIRYDAPQGSILGPLLFLIFSNDLKNSANLLDSIMVADDTNLLLSKTYLKRLIMNFSIFNLHFGTT